MSGRTERHTHECSHVADTAAPLGRQILVGMNAATAGGETRLLADGNQVPVLGLDQTGGTARALEANWWS
jgi:hypothetical protein